MIAQDTAADDPYSRAPSRSSGEVLGQGGWHNPGPPVCPQHDESLSGPWALVVLESLESSVTEQSRGSREFARCGPDTSYFFTWLRDKHATRYRRSLNTLVGLMSLTGTR